MASPDDDDPLLYAPPAIDSPPAKAAPPIPGQASPGLVGFLAVLVTSGASAFLAFGAMVVWHENITIGTGFLAGLGEVIVAMLSWAALWAFATLTSIILAVGLVGRRGRVPAGAWLLVGILAACAALVCFVPLKGTDADLFRGSVGLCTEAICTVMSYFAMRHARRVFVGPPPPPWMMDVGEDPAPARKTDDSAADG